MKSKVGYKIIENSLNWENEELKRLEANLAHTVKQVESFTRQVVLAKLRIEDLEAELSEDSITIK